MLEILKFIFSSFWVFCGFTILLSIAGGCLVAGLNGLIHIETTNIRGNVYGHPMADDEDED